MELIEPCAGSERDSCFGAVFTHVRPTFCREFHPDLPTEADRWSLNSGSWESRESSGRNLGSGLIKTSSFFLGRWDIKGPSLIYQYTAYSWMLPNVSPVQRQARRALLLKWNIQGGNTVAELVEEGWGEADKYYRRLWRTMRWWVSYQGLKGVF